MKLAQIIVISYFIGCFSSAYFIGKLFRKIDIRGHGSGNAGATNALRVMGIRLGALTFIFDMLKGILAVYIGKHIMGFSGGLLAGFFAVVGHNWPLFIKFKGGKGVATSIGVLMVTNIPTFIISAIIGIVVIIKTRFVSLGSLSFLLSIPIIYMLVSKEVNIEFLVLSAALGLLSILRHKENIKRLKNGTENKLGR